MKSSAGAQFKSRAKSRTESDPSPEDLRAAVAEALAASGLVAPPPLILWVVVRPEGLDVSLVDRAFVAGYAKREPVLLRDVLAAHQMGARAAIVHGWGGWSTFMQEAA